MSATSTSPTYQFIQIERRDAVTVLFVNRPSVMNAIDRATLGEIADAVRAFVADPAQGALIVTGRGEKAFIAGADIPELAPLGPAAAEDISRYGQSVVELLERSPKPVIAAVNGYAFGGGCELALACHMRLASENMVMGLPEVKLGIIPGYGGTQRLPRLVGVEKALDMIVSGNPIGAAEAASAGLVDRLAEGDVVDAAVAFARELVAAGKGPRPASAARIDPAALPAGIFDKRRAGLARHPSGPMAARNCIAAVEAAVGKIGRAHV